MSNLDLNPFVVNYGDGQAKLVVISGRQLGVVGDSPVPSGTGKPKSESARVDAVWNAATAAGLAFCPDGIAETIASQAPERLAARIIHFVGDGPNGKHGYIETDGKVIDYPYKPDTRHDPDCLYLFVLP